MKLCPTCAREIADSDSVCATCAAWAAAVVEARPADAAAPAAEKPALKGQPAAAAATPGPSARRATSRRQLTLIAAAAVAAVALTGLALSARGGSRSDASASLAAAVPPAHVTTTPATAPAASAVPDVQTWTENQAAWLNNPRRGAAFELLSENVVRTGFGATRPLLVVRCISHRIEAFVVTGSPMKIDPRVDGKAVTISVDGEPFRTEQWIDSDSHTEVFAPDPTAFTQRLRTARTLQFGYSPHNSSDVVAQFHVAGIDALIGAASKHCSAPK